MKQLITILAIAAVLASCASANKKADVLEISLERVFPANAPKAVKDAVRKAASKDVLVGVGTAKMVTIDLAMAFAEARALTDISRQVNLVTKEIVRYYVQTSQTDPSIEETFRETIRIQLSETTLQGVSPIFRYVDTDGAWWIVSVMEKPALANELGEAQVSAKTATPEMADFDAQKLLNSAVIINK